ncbi:MAG: hypothetical protein ATN31_01810 [Candidatus Epulonipiscioides saccharophilum]|nr:MAG: hypothetical protein ATN31_01810 [Epulopiscium sp. AS2M-Bin001]
MKTGGPLKGFAEFSRAVAAQGTILLKNDNNFLPLQKQETVAVFGRCQLDYYNCGTGSGGSVTVMYSTDFINSLKSRNKVIVNETLYDIYTDWVSKNPVQPSNIVKSTHYEEMEITDSCVKEAAQVSEKAIIVIGRTAGEDNDNTNTKGSFFLTDTEKNLIEQVCKHFDKVGVILNVSNIMDMSWENKKISSIVYAWHGGMEGGNAIVDVILGNATPSGKLPDTIPIILESSLSNHIDKNSTEFIYEDDIYVGYRYYETFAKDKVKYPFGFGLSYTKFKIELLSFNLIGPITNSKSNGIEIKVLVTNIGNRYNGKEVVQVYVEAPQGQLGQPARKLITFAKTHLLNQGESEILTLFSPFFRSASFDDSGISGFKSAYVLEAGEYFIHVGNNVRDDQCPVNSFKINNTIVLKQVEEAMAPSMSFKRIKPVIDSAGRFHIDHETVPTQTIDLAQRIEERIPNEIPYTGDQGYKLKQVGHNQISMEKFIAQFSPAELEILVRGEGASHPNVTPGTASAFGGVSKKLREFGIPLICCADGPSGIRMEGGLAATLIPIGTQLSSTWDYNLIEMLYSMEGKELIKNNIDLLLAPGINIHHNLLNGRNFEYYSEDPLLCGKIASAVVKGIRKSGVDATVKHFACSGQETNKRRLNNVVSERALREIYLKGFEMVIKEGKVNSVMTASNKINGYYCASNYDLNTTILRKEWNYDGFVMTDWWTCINDIVNKGEGSQNNLANMIKAQNDVYMTVGNYGAELNENHDNIHESLNNGNLKLSELQRAAINICRFALKTNAFKRGHMLFENTHFPAQTGPIPKLIVNNILEIENTDNLFYFESSGKFQINVTYSSTAKGLGQTACNVLLNDFLVTTIHVGNTNGKTFSKKLANVKMDQGNYNLKLDYIPGALKITKIEFIKL